MSKLLECSNTKNLPTSDVPNTMLLLTLVIVPIARSASPTPRKPTFAFLGG